MIALFAVGLLLSCVATAVFLAAGGIVPGVAGIAAAGITIQALRLWTARRPSASGWSNAAFSADLLLAGLAVTVAWVNGFGWETADLPQDARLGYQAAVGTLLAGSAALAAGLIWVSRFDIDGWVGHTPPPVRRLDARKLLPLHAMFVSGATVAAYVGWRADGWISAALAAIAGLGIAASWGWHARKRWSRHLRSPLMLVSGFLALWGALLSAIGTSPEPFPFLALCVVCLISVAATVVVGLRSDYRTWWEVAEES